MSECVPRPCFRCAKEEPEGVCTSLRKVKIGASDRHAQGSGAGCGSDPDVVSVRVAPAIGSEPSCSALLIRPADLSQPLAVRHPISIRSHLWDVAILVQSSLGVLLLIVAPATGMCRQIDGSFRARRVLA